MPPPHQASRSLARRRPAETVEQPPPAAADRRSAKDRLAAPLRAWQAAFNRAGGVFWHLQALRYARRRWAPTRSALHDALAAWQPSEGALLLIGPSAGYLLERPLLERFASLTALDPDPLAPWLFRRRFRGLDVRFARTDYLGPATTPLRPERLDQLFADYPGHAVLFCNVLSQLTALYPTATGAVRDPPADSAAFLAFKARLRQHLEGRSWASFHDRLSANRPPARAALQLDAELDALTLAERCWTLGEGESLAVYDHQLAGLAPALPRRLLHWPRRPGMDHLVEVLACAR